MRTDPSRNPVFLVGTPVSEAATTTDHWRSGTSGVTQNVTVVHIPLVCQASVRLQHMPWVISSSEFLRSTHLKIGDSLHTVSVFSLQAMDFGKAISANPREAAEVFRKVHGTAMSTCKSDFFRAFFKVSLNSLSSSQLSCMVQLWLFFFFFLAPRVEMVMRAM